MIRLQMKATNNCQTKNRDDVSLVKSKKFKSDEKIANTSLYKNLTIYGFTDFINKKFKIQSRNT